MTHTWFSSFPSEVFSLWISGLAGCFQGKPAAGLSSELFSGWQQALLHQVSLEGVKDVELLIDAEGQELLDHLGGVGAPERGRAG